MLKETETEKKLSFFVTFLLLVAFQLGGSRPPGPLWLYLCEGVRVPGKILLLGAHLYIIVGAHLNWLVKIELKGPGPPGSVLLLGADLNWGPFKYYCRGPS